MMGCAHRVDSMSLYEYEAVLWHHNEAHRGPGDVEPPDPEVATALVEKLNNDPRFTGP